MIRIDINSSASINEVNEPFRAKFPYLRLEFFAFKTGGNFREDKKHLIIEKDVALGKLFPKFRKASISLSGNLKARTLENMITEQSGLHVQVFRKSGSVWLETIITDSKTLTALNTIGMESETSFAEDNNIDYQEQD